ncbi:MAG TPA: hypothetical protein VK909_08315 [Anaerolineales bacterium]|jgi:hypothetical protein|nr:hypothetical protein [Anaerolineales bacterium]
MNKRAKAKHDHDPCNQEEGNISILKKAGMIHVAKFETKGGLIFSGLEVTLADKKKT